MTVLGQNNDNYLFQFIIFKVKDLLNAMNPLYNLAFENKDLGASLIKIG